MDKQSKFEFQLKRKHTTMCFFILIEIMYGFAFTPLDFTGVFHDVFLYSALFMAVISLLLRHDWNVKQLLKTGITLMIGALVYVLANETLFLIMMLAAILVGDIGYQKAFKTIFWVRLPMLVIVLFCTLVGIFPVGLVMVTKGAYGTEAAYGLGYIHPNCLGQEIYFLCSLYICYRNKNTKKSELIIIFIINIIAYLVTKSKTACLLTGILILFIFFYDILIKWVERHRESLARILVCISILFPLISIGGSYIYTSATGKLQYYVYHLNTLLNGRLSNGSIMYARFPLKLFGTQIDLSTLSRFYSYFIVDNGYIFSLFNFGIFPFILLIAMYIYSLYRLILKRKYIYAANLFLFLMCIVSENVMRAMFVNFSVLLCYEFYAEEKKLDYIICQLVGGKHG